MLVNAVAPFEGELHWVGTPREGNSQTTGEPRKMVDFTVKYQNSQMQEQFITFSLSGVDRVNRLLTLPIGQKIRVNWLPEARPYTDPNTGVSRWFPSMKALGFVTPQVQQQAAQPAQQPPQQQFQQQAYAQPQHGYSQQQQPAPQPGIDDLPWA